MWLKCVKNIARLFHSNAVVLSMVTNFLISSVNSFHEILKSNRKTRGTVTMHHKNYSFPWYLFIASKIFNLLRALRKHMHDNLNKYQGKE